MVFCRTLPIGWQAHRGESARHQPAPGRALLLEGIHHSAIETLESAGFAVETLPGALEPDDLQDALAGVTVLGIRSRTRLDADFLRESDDLTAVGCFCTTTRLFRPRP